jgi:hypothetical protein
MVGDDLLRLVLEIGVVDAKMGVEPVDFIFDKVLGNESLSHMGELMWPNNPSTSTLTFSATACSTRARCSSLPLKTGVL